jgi:kynurenine formamidase
MPATMLRARPQYLVPLALAAGCARAPAPSTDLLSGRRVVDLSHAYDEATVFWPTEEGFRLEKEQDGMTPGGWYYASNRFSTPEHGGTHVDAPIHFAKGHPTVDAIAVERLIGPLAVVDVAAACARDRDYQVQIADLDAWERAHGRLPAGAIVLLRTGFGRFWPDREAYMGTSERGPDAVAKLHFPGLHPDAARWLATARKVKAVGLDTPSIDFGQSRTFESHRALFERDVPAFENVANLDALPAAGAWVIALPMKIRGGSGGPLRIVALVPDRERLE